MSTAAYRPRRIEVCCPMASRRLRDAARRQIAEQRAPGSGAHRHAVRPAAGRAPAGAMEEVPELLVTGLQAVEDRDFSPPSRHRFRRHPARGLGHRAFGGETRQGASTLTQQLARSGLLGIGKEQTLTRKFNEDPVRAADRGALRQAHHPRGVLQPGLPRPARRQAIHGVAAAPNSGSGATCATSPPNRSRC